MKKNLLTFVLFLFLTTVFAQENKVAVVNNSEGVKLLVNGKDFMINGMNWDYFPIGTNYNYSLWKQSDELIKAALDNEMSFLKNMHVNTIRAYVGIQPKWIKYIYENYGIYTVLNHTFGRYGLTLEGEWVANTEYSDPRVHRLLNKEAEEMVNTYKGTPGLLMYLLGNENNYGLFWSGAETEDIPLEDRQSTHRAKALYQMFNESVQKMKSIDTSLPIAICNGDALFIDILAAECKDVDVLGINCYRGISFTDVFTKIKQACPNKPIIFTEFGADAYNAITQTEEQYGQAVFDVANWKEIYENAAGMGKSENCIGGFTFQFSDGWWKTGQTTELDVHNTISTWNNGGYSYDFKPGVNNMNEEWFGICAKGETYGDGLYHLYPRAAYYALQEAHTFNPYAAGANLQTLQEHFAKIQIKGNELKARGDKATLEGEQSKKYSLSIRGEISTYSTGGSNITTPSSKNASATAIPNKLGFDHMESYYLGFDAKPNDNVRANVTLNVIGNVANNAIDEIFYENKAREAVISTGNGDKYDLNLAKHIGIYKAEYSWDTKLYNLKGFYRTGHFHWGYEGDFFGLYPETNYGPNLDIYHGEAPFGFEVAGKKGLDGFKVAFGPELWWGANPAVLVKYQKKIGKYTLAGIFQEDLDRKASSTSTQVQPQQQTRKATLYAKRNLGLLGVEVGGIWAGSPLNGMSFNVWDADNERLYQDVIGTKDNWGGKLKFTIQRGNFNWYLQGAAKGLVAEGGADWTRTFTGWRLKDSGSGNQYNVLTGILYNLGKFQIAPNFLYQKPFVAAIPEGAVDKKTGVIGHSRNIKFDPFSVRGNRETIAGELLLGYDPTPATWMWEWDNDIQEDAPFAASLDFVYRHQPTTMDATTGYLANGTAYALAAPAAHDVWEVNSHVVSKLTNDFGFIVNLLGGTAQPNGPDARIVKRYGGDVNLIYKKVKMMGSVKMNDYGPYDYHRDYNLTFPMQVMADLSTYINKPQWINMPDTKLGLRCTYRTLDQYSNRFDKASTENGSEWEIRTYVHFNIGK
jgi:hypothetical protein